MNNHHEKMSVVVATVNSNEINKADKQYDLSYNRVNNCFNFYNISTSLVSKNHSEVSDLIGEDTNNAYEIKEWTDTYIEHYQPVIKDCRGHNSKLRHSNNEDGTYYRTETVSAKELMNDTNTEYVFIVTPDNTVYCYDGDFFGKLTIGDNGIINVDVNTSGLDLSKKVLNS